MGVECSTLWVAREIIHPQPDVMRFVQKVRVGASYGPLRLRAPRSLGDRPLRLPPGGSDNLNVGP
jgi:hypothetical protein